MTPEQLEHRDPLFGQTFETAADGTSAATPSANANAQTVREHVFIPAPQSPHFSSDISDDRGYGHEI